MQHTSYAAATTAHKTIKTVYFLFKRGKLFPFTTRRKFIGFIFYYLLVVKVLGVIINIKPITINQL